jgi:acetylornithine deacetylase/succinyl-diaminopimelate desuccinylase-like protein
LDLQRRITVATLSLLALLWLPAATAGKAARPAADRAGGGEPAFRALYKELVETDTSLSAGDCTLAAERMAVHLRAAGYAGDDVRVFSVPEHPKEGGLVARLAGSDPTQKGVLLLAHLDVVEARREDWTRDPFTLFEEDGYFYARGAADDKAMAAIYTDLMVRLRNEGYRPRKRITLALTCGEETSGAFNGAYYLAHEHRDWIDADLALNEGASGELDQLGRRLYFNFQAGEKLYRDYQFEVTNPGGHSGRPVPDNAIYALSTALTRVAGHEFPVMFNDTTRTYFARMAGIVGGEQGAAMRAILRNPDDAPANAVVSADKMWHSLLRTTCVATMIQGGHAPNALPQRVAANVNCRIFPGVEPESVLQTLQRVVDDPRIHISIKPEPSRVTAPPRLDPALLALIDAVAGELYPGVPVLPFMNTGASDGAYLDEVGIPTVGVEGLFVDPDNGNIHGLNERIRVQSVMDGRRFQYKLVKAYAGS